VLAYSHAMLVRALCLRRDGVKLTRERLRQETPMVGSLRYEASYFGGKDGNGAYACLLMPITGTTEPEVQLHHAKVIKVEARGILIQGQEYRYRRKERISFPQTLWCWPISPDEGSVQVAHPDDAEDEDAALQEALMGR